ncbi:MAG: hypothetical protein RLZZ387_4472 [Chloroflexota bacterium]|jgi:uncharacterized membrane protein YkvA (DUF1232 family)
MNQSTVRRIGAVIGIVVGAIYLLNPTAGLLEIIPDITPFIGNLDEAGATALLLWGVQQLRQKDPVPLPPGSDRRVER